MLRRVPSIVAVLAASLWLGGMATLGAIVAPSVFGVVPAPASADAMTLAFRRFDRVAMICASFVLLSELLRLLVTIRTGSRMRAHPLDLARLGVALGATALCAWQAMVLSPRIEALHRAGAIRGAGEAGMALDSTHRLVETEAKWQLLLVVALVVLHLLTVPDTDLKLRKRNS